MVTKTTTRKFTFTKQELIDSVLFVEAPNITVEDIEYIGTEPGNPLNIVVSLFDDVSEEL